MSDTIEIYRLLWDKRVNAITQQRRIVERRPRGAPKQPAKPRRGPTAGVRGKPPKASRTVRARSSLARSQPPQPKPVAARPLSAATFVGTTTAHNERRFMKMPRARTGGAGSRKKHAVRRRARSSRRARSQPAAPAAAKQRRPTTTSTRTRHKHALPALSLHKVLRSRGQSAWSEKMRASARSYRPVLKHATPRVQSARQVAGWFRAAEADSPVDGGHDAGADAAQTSSTTFMTDSGAPSAVSSPELEPTNHGKLHGVPELSFDPLVDQQKIEDSTVEWVNSGRIHTVMKAVHPHSRGRRKQRLMAMVASTTARLKAGTALTTVSTADSEDSEDEQNEDEQDASADSDNPEDGASASSGDYADSHASKEFVHKWEEKSGWERIQRHYGQYMERRKPDDKHVKKHLTQAAAHERRKDMAGVHTDEEKRVFKAFNDALPPLDFVSKAVRQLLLDNADLIEMGYLDLNTSVSATQSTLLHTAVWFRKVRIIKLMVEYGADPNAQNLKGNAPLHFACEHCTAKKEHAETVLSLLLLAGGQLDLQSTTKETRTPLELFADAPRIAQQVQVLRSALEKQKRFEESTQGVNPRDLYSYGMWDEWRQVWNIQTAGPRVASSKALAACRLQSEEHKMRRAREAFAKLKLLVEKKGSDVYHAVYEGIPQEEPKAHGWGTVERRTQARHREAARVKAEKEKSDRNRRAAADLAAGATLLSSKPEAGSTVASKTLASQAQSAVSQKVVEDPLKYSPKYVGFPDWLWKIPHFVGVYGRGRARHALGILQTQPVERSDAEVRILADWVSGDQAPMPFLQNLPYPLIMDLCRVIHVEAFRAGDLIYRRGTLANKLCMLISGTCVQILDGDNDDRFLEPGATFGEDILFKHISKRQTLWKKLRRSVELSRKIQSKRKEESKLWDDPVARLQQLQRQEQQQRKNRQKKRQCGLTFADVVELAMSYMRKDTVVAHSGCLVAWLEYRCFTALEYQYRKGVQNKAIHFLRTVECFQNWRYQQLRRLAMCFSVQVYHKGDVICRQGGPASRMWFCLEGSVTLCREVEVVKQCSFPLAWNMWRTDQSSHLHRLDVAHVRSKDFFGEEGLFSCPRLDFTAVCTSDKVRLLVVNSKHFWHLTVYKWDAFYFEERVKNNRRAAATAVRENLAALYPASERVSPFPLFIWDPHAEPRKAPHFVPLDAGCVHVNFDPVLAADGQYPVVDPPREHDVMTHVLDPGRRVNKEKAFVAPKPMKVRQNVNRLTPRAKRTDDAVFFASPGAMKHTAFNADIPLVSPPSTPNPAGMPPTFARAATPKSMAAMKPPQRSLPVLDMFDSGSPTESSPPATPRQYKRPTSNMGFPLSHAIPLGVQVGTSDSSPIGSRPSRKSSAFFLAEQAAGANSRGGHYYSPRHALTAAVQMAIDRQNQADASMRPPPEVIEQLFPSRHVQRRGSTGTLGVQSMRNRHFFAVRQWQAGAWARAAGKRRKSLPDDSLGLPSFALPEEEREEHKLKERHKQTRQLAAQLMPPSDAQDADEPRKDHHSPKRPARSHARPHGHHRHSRHRRPSKRRSHSVGRAEAKEATGVVIGQPSKQPKPELGTSPALMSMYKYARERAQHDDVPQSSSSASEESDTPYISDSGSSSSNGSVEDEAITRHSISSRPRQHSFVIARKWSHLSGKAGGGGGLGAPSPVSRPRAASVAAVGRRNVRTRAHTSVLHAAGPRRSSNSFSTARWELSAAARRHTVVGGRTPVPPSRPRAGSRSSAHQLHRRSINIV